MKPPLKQLLIDLFMLKPLYNKVLIKPDEIETKTASGIILKEDSRPVTGEVIAVGPGLDGVVPTVKPGDKIVYGKFSGRPVKYDNVEYMIMPETDIDMVI